MDQIKQHFDEEAQKFDRIIQQLIPYYDQMLQALISAIPFSMDYPIQVLDLGCGTGTLAGRMLEAFPQSHITCLDFSEQMIEMARAKLANFDRVSYAVQDFREHSFADRYHVVVSSLALHHLATEAEKQAFYQKIYQGLLPDGCFYNADVVLAASEYLQSIYIKRWKAFMQRQVSEGEVENVWLRKYAEEDRPAPLVEQLAWLSRIGYENVDVLWKYYNFAVYGGVKSGDS
ncbi:MAG TPA: methyltransferase domain-containing protein [Anaerolineales bacterium]|nr:methyltransferase domain-containing protein [Anaerolineales bacterium]